MIDLHCHILPSVDDGADSMEQSVEFGRVADAEGIECLVATPHWRLQGVSRNELLTPEGIREAVAEVQRAFRSAGIRAALLPGAEVRFSPELPEQLQRGEVTTIGDLGRHVLVELAPQHLPAHLGEVLFQVQLQNITPVIAHPERNLAIQEDPDRLRPYLERGVEVQMDAASVLGEHGRPAQRAATDLLRAGLVTYVASDAHQAHELARLRMCRRRLDRAAGRGAGERLTRRAPARLLRGAL